MSESEAIKPCSDHQTIHGTAVISGTGPTTIEYKGDQKFEVGDVVQWVLVGRCPDTPEEDEEEEPEKQWKPSVKPTGNGAFSQTSKWNH